MIFYRHCGRNGFTRVELVVVMACISLLAGVLWATPRRARQQAKSIVCQTYLHNWGRIFEAFFQDNDGFFIGGDRNPEAQSFGGGTPGAEAWPRTLFPYYENQGIRFCPVAPVVEDKIYGDHETAWNVNTAYLGFDEIMGSYGINNWVYNPPPGVTTSWGFTLEGENYNTPNVPDADEAPLFLECVITGSFALGTDGPPTFPQWPYYHSSLLGRYCMDRHGNGRLNGLFLDGHARSIGCKELWTLKWSRGFNRKNAHTLAGGATRNLWEEEAPWMADFKDY